MTRIYDGSSDGFYDDEFDREPEDFDWLDGEDEWNSWED